MTGVPGLQHVERAGTVPDLTDDDPIRPKAKRCLHQVANRDRRHRALRQQLQLIMSRALQLDRILDQDDAVVDDCRLGEQCIEKCGLA